MPPQDGDREDLANQFPAMVARLTDIVDNGSTYTAAQTRDAVVDLARVQRRVLRIMAYLVGLK